MRPLLLFLLVAGCVFFEPAETKRVTKNPGIDGAWVMGDVRLDATGDVVTLEFGERTFVFSNVEVFRGEISTEHVRLRAGPLEIRVDEERIAIHRRGSRDRSWALADLPTDRPIVYEGRELTWRR